MSDQSIRVIFHTQFFENYGAHDWDGEGYCSLVPVSSRVVPPISFQGLPRRSAIRSGGTL